MTRANLSILMAILLLLSCNDDKVKKKNACSFYTFTDDSSFLYIGVSKKEVEKRFPYLKFINRDYLDQYLPDEVYVAFTDYEINGKVIKIYHEFAFKKDSLFKYNYFFPMAGLEFDSILKNVPIDFTEKKDTSFFNRHSLEYIDSSCSYKHKIYERLYINRVYHIRNQYIDDKSIIFEGIVTTVDKKGYAIK